MTCTHLYSNCACWSICTNVFGTGSLLCPWNNLEPSANMQETCTYVDACMSSSLPSERFYSIEMLQLSIKTPQLVILLHCLGKFLRNTVVFLTVHIWETIHCCWPLVSVNLSKPIFILPWRSAGCLFSISIKVVGSIVLCMLLGSMSQQPLKPLFPLSEIDVCNMQILRKRKL